MLFSLAVLPAVALLIYVYKMDKKEKEPTKFLWRLFRWGVFIIIPTYLIESILDFFVEAITIVGSIPYAILDAFIVAACTEELLKYYCISTKLTSIKEIFKDDGLQRIWWSFILRSKKTSSKSTWK